MRVLFGVVILGVVVGPVAFAQPKSDVVVDLKAPDPVAKLPVISTDGMNFQRAFRKLRPKCKKFDIYVEDGGIDATVSEPQYSSSQLVGGCGEAKDAFAGNLTAINAAMSGTRPIRPAKQGRLVKGAPAMFEADGMRVDVTAAAASAFITVNRLDRAVKDAWIGSRRMATDMRPVGVRAWYVVDQPAHAGKQRQLAVLVAGRQPDGTLAEKWMEVWVTKAPAKRQPIDIARAWLLAYAAKDAKALAALSADKLDRVGLDPVTGPARYMAVYDEAEFQKLSKQPPELKPHAKVLAKHAAAQQFLFSSDDSKGAMYVVLAVKGDKVAAVVEAAK